MLVSTLRSQDKTNQQKVQVYTFLKTHPVGVLASVDPDNLPHIAVVYFGIEPSLSATFITKRGTKKHDNIVHNNKVMMLAYEPVSQTTVQVRGIVEEISNESDMQQAFMRMINAANQTSASGSPPISQLQSGQYVACRLQPSQISMQVYGAPKSSKNSQIVLDF